MADEGERAVRALIAASDPFASASRRCYACGTDNAHGLRMRVDRDENRHEARCEIVLDPHLQGWDGIAHGGVVATLLDEVLTYSLIERRPVFTVDLSVRYRQAVPLGVPLRLSARRTLARGRFLEAEGEVRGPGGELLATARAKYLRPRDGAPRGEA
jgi:acyl-coenzyme A thioesterase PaaI-like protein